MVTALVSARFFCAACCVAIVAAASFGADLDIDVEGNEAFGNRAIRAELPPRPEEITRESVRFWQNDAVFFVREFYYDHGFFDASISATREQTGEEQWMVRVRIDEGEQYVYDTVRVITPDTTLAIVNMQRLNARPGEPFRGRDILKDRQNIIRQFGNRGFLHPAITDSVMFHDDRKTISVRYFVKPSYQALFDTLIIRRFRARADTLAGLTQTDLLRSLVPYDRGDTITARQNDNVIEKLQSTGVFTYVRFKDTLLSETGRTGLILIAEERAPGNLRASLFYETQYGPGVSGRIRHRNIGGSLDEARFSALLALDKQNVTAGYGSPLTFGYLLRFDADIDLNWFQDAEVHDTLGLELFGGDFEGSATARFSRTITEWTRAITSAEVLGERRYASVDSTSFGISLNFISTVFFTFVDRIIDPRRGSRYALTFGNGGPLYENDQFRFLSSRHNWLELETAYYTMLIDQLQLAGRIDGGAFVNDGGLNSDRFYLGGPRDIRAFGFRDVCPAGVNDICGEAPELRPAYYLASAEIRFAPFDFGYIPPGSFLNFITPLQFVPFVDFGQVWDLNDSFAPPWLGAGQALAYGVGLRYPLFGVFNLRLDFAWGQSWEPEQDAFSFVIDLAQAF